MGEKTNFWDFANRNEGCVVIGCALLPLVLLVVTIASCDMHNTRVYAKNGYEQVQKQGTTDTMWVKKGGK